MTPRQVDVLVRLRDRAARQAEGEPSGHAGPQQGTAADLSILKSYRFAS